MVKQNVSQPSLRDKALEKENLRLQRKIAKLEAQVVSLRHRNIARGEIQQLADEKAAADAAKRRGRANYDETDA